jgi:hypothetical protein
MGHGAFVRELPKDRSRSLGSVEKHFARDDTSVKGVGHPLNLKEGCDELAEILSEEKVGR